VIDLLPANVPSPEAVRIVRIDGVEGDNGGDAGDTLCYSAANGDVNDDGLPDLLINEMEGDGRVADGPDGGSEPDVVDDVGNLLLIDGPSLLGRVLLDIDGDGLLNPFTDGVLFLRHLLTFTGDALTADAVAQGATRTGPEIEAYLAQVGAALDSDADDTLGPFTDGVLALRYLFTFTGPVLVQDALALDAQREDPDAIVDFLDRLRP
jgi:hypothetical protein